MNRGVKLGLAAVAVGLLVGGGGYWYFGQAPAQPPDAAQQQQLGVQPVAIEAERVAVEQLTAEINAVGSFQSSQSVMIEPEIAGRISRIFMRDGAEVRAGTALFQLDPTILEAELAQARANLTLSEANYERTETLFRQGSSTARARDEARARLHSDRAALELAEARLQKTTIVAPFDGVLGLRSVDLGAYVGPGNQLVNLEDIDPLRVEFRVPEIYRPALRAGLRIEVAPDAYPKRTFSGRIYAIDPQIDVNGRAVRLRADVPNAERLLSPGMFVRLRIIVAQRENALLVPESAIVPRGESKFVYRVEGGRALLTEVRLGERRPGKVEVLDGVAPDDVVVTAGQQKLHDGAPVELIVAASTGA